MEEGCSYKENKVKLYEYINAQFTKTEWRVWTYPCKNCHSTFLHTHNSYQPQCAPKRESCYSIQHSQQTCNY